MNHLIMPCEGLNVSAKDQVFYQKLEKGSTTKNRVSVEKRNPKQPEEGNIDKNLIYR